jgi:hypothetical protein
MEKLDVVQIVIGKDQFYIGEKEGFLYLGVLSPSWFTAEQTRSHCLNEGVPWVHISLAQVDVAEGARVKAALQDSLQSVWNGVNGPDIHLYFEASWTHGDSDTDTKCSLQHAVCIKGALALTDVLRATILTSKPQGGVWNNGRKPHISVLNAICLKWKKFSIGHLQLQQNSYALDFSRDVTFEKASDSHLLKKTWAKYFLRECIYRAALRKETIGASLASRR